jgi:hypothetical protein
MNNEQFDNELLGQTDNELYEALYDMGYDFGEFDTDDFDEDGFAETAVNLGYRWDEAEELWYND